MNNALNYRDYKQFSSPGEYKEVAESIGCRIPLQFFIAVSKIMKANSMTFGETCQLLEEREYLVWVGKVAIYAIEGDSLWQKSEEKAT